jgi:DNA replication protein DnaC
MTKLVSFQDQEKYKLMINKHFDSIENPTPKDISDLHNSFNGGNCYECGKPWESFHVLSKMADYKGYRPTCECGKEDDEKLSYDEEVRRFNERSRIPVKFFNSRLSNFDTVDIKNGIKKAYDQVMEYIDKKKYREKSIVLYGDPGTGKTHMAVAIMKYISIKEKYSAMHIRMSSFIKDMINKKLNDISSKKILLLDDLEKIDTDMENQWSNSNVHTLFDAIYSDEKIFISTSNYKDLNEFKNLYRPEIIDRIFEISLFIPVDGDSYRLKK